MPVTRSEALFFAGGLAAGVAAVAAFPWLKRKYEAMQQSSAEIGDPAATDLGRKLAETVEGLLKNAPEYVDAGKSGLQAGFEAACRMAQTISRPVEPSEASSGMTESGQAA